MLGTAEPIIDLAEPVDPERDHIRGPAEAPVTVVEYGDFECPYCGRAESVVRELLAEFGDVRYVWRHLPLTDVHPRAQVAAEAAEAAAAQGKFWEMHDLLLDHQDALLASDLSGYAEELGLDVERFEDDLRRQVGRRPHRGGRRLRRPERRLGHADVLHQRPAALRRVRHRHAVGRGAGGPGARGDRAIARSYWFGAEADALRDRLRRPGRRRARLAPE